MQIVITSGGQGTRLWPISTKETPKQFCKIIGGKSLLQLTFDRLTKKFPKECIWVSTNKDYLNLLKKQLPDLDPTHILTEPERRDTFPAVISHSALVASKTSVDESIVFISSDHYITPEKSIIKHNLALEKIDESLQQDKFDLMVVGIKPTFPSTNYGYIHISDKKLNKCFEEGVKVISFKEKPNLETANLFLKEKNYLWNFGSFSFKYSKLLKILEKTNPSSLKPLQEIFQAKEILLEPFRKLEKTSFDYAVLEKIENLGMFGMELAVWDDIGSFDTLYNYLPHITSDKEAYKLQENTNPNHYQIGGEYNKAQTQKLKKVAFVGVSNLVLIETETEILIVNPKKSALVKKVADYFS